MLRTARRLLASVLAAAHLCGCAPWSSIPASGPPEAGRLNVDVLTDAADQAALLRAYGGAYRLPSLDAYLATVLRQLGGGGDWSITMLDSPAVNAFALPSGRISVTRGLLALADDEAEVAAVIAHEMAHVTLRHADKRDEAEARAALAGPADAPVGRAPPAPASARTRGTASFLRFSREQEFEADAEGMRRLAAAGYDVRAAPRLLRKLAAAAALASAERSGLAVHDIALTHPATAARIARAAELARSLRPDGRGRADRERYLAAIDGMAFGDDPRDGVVRGHRFIHPRLGVRFDAPAPFRLENTPRAVVGATDDGNERLLFDAVEGDRQDLGAVLTDSWSDPLAEGSLHVSSVGGREAAVATAWSDPWHFRLGAVRLGSTTYRLIMASTTGGPAFEAGFDATLASIAPVPAPEASGLRPQRLVIARAARGDTADDLAGRMAAREPLRLFLLLNGLQPGERLRLARSYKLVSD